MFETFIQNIRGREILDSRGNPTVEAQVVLTDGTVATGIAPSGASTGEFEALELRDMDDKRYLGRGVKKAVDNINSIIHSELLSKRAFDIYEIDDILKKADGTEDKSNLGANAMLAVSIAVARAAAKSKDISLYRFLGGANANRMPVPMMNILNGGAHAKNTVDFQEFMIVPVGACCFKEALRMGAEVYHSLKKLLNENNKSTAVGDEGGFAPDLSNTFMVFDYLTKAVELAGYKCGKDIMFAMDAAASELYDETSGMYYFPGETKSQSDGKNVVRSTIEMVQLYEELCSRYPIFSIEDGLDEEDWEGWKILTERLGHKVQLVGDDLFVTNTKT